MKPVRVVVVLVALSVVGCATGRQELAFSTISGTDAFEIFASPDEAWSATRMIFERRGLTVLEEDPETGSIQVGTSDERATVRVSISSMDRQVRIVTSYYREVPAGRVDQSNVAESLSLQVREINDEIRDVLVNLPPRTSAEQNPD